MAEEVEPGKGAEAAPQAPLTPEAAPAAPSWSWSLLALAVAAVLLTLVGVFTLARPVPQTLALGAGLFLWGLLDLLAQRRGLGHWKGPKAALGNAVNLTRALALLGLGVWLGLMALGLAKPAPAPVIIWTGVFLVGLYLAAALLIEMLVKGVRLGAQAFLLASLVLMLFSYFYFSIPFIYAWAAVFAFLSFAAAAWAVHKNVLVETPFVGLAVLLAVLVLGAPISTYTFQQAHEVEEQPLFTPTLLIPRMRQVVTGLSAEAAQIRWAPAHTQPGQPGDVRFSDKVAFVDQDKGQACVKLFQQHEDGLREILRVSAGAGVSLSAFSTDGSRVAYTDPGRKSPVLRVLAPSSPSSPLEAALPAAPARIPFSLKHALEWLADLVSPQPAATAAPVPSSAPLAYRSMRLYADVSPEPAHGQVWRSMGKQLYFSAPAGGPQNQDSAVLRYDFPGGKPEVLIANRAMPAVSPDERSLLTVGYVPNKRNLEISDVDSKGVAGSERPFVALNEASYFPAWNDIQTEVLFIDPVTRRLMAMNSNGRNHRPFDPMALDSHNWKSEKLVPFELNWEETGDRFRIYRSRPDGNGDHLIYDTAGQWISPPQWSADGKRIAFIIRNHGKSEVVTVGSDGTWPRHFFTTEDALDELKWSPDGLKVAWICRRQDDTQEIWTAGYEGLDPVRVHQDDGELKDLTWSPRGKHLAVQVTKPWTFLGMRLVRPALQNVLMVDLTDLHARVMTRYGILSHGPAFSPHGDAIAYFTDQDAWTFVPTRERKTALVISQLY
ncbi:MAG TPA: hypothetical protein VK914_05090 [bacterium]|jgi:hypothetical protein|nr:hypothetical protein [bacterium]